MNMVIILEVLIATGHVSSSSNLVLVRTRPLLEHRSKQETVTVNSYITPCILKMSNFIS